MIRKYDSGTVLVVEDNAAILEGMRYLIEAAGYSVLCAEDGQTALRQLCQRSALPRAILLDLMMPQMDGWQLLNELQRNAVFAKIPVVVVSALNLDDSCFPGAAGYLRKPVKYDRLLAVLEEVGEGASHDKNNVGRNNLRRHSQAQPSRMLGNQLDLQDI